MLRHSMLVVLLGAAAIPAWAEGGGDTMRGDAYANAMCQSCHATRQGDAASTNPEAPPFRAIKLTFKTGDEFATFMNTKHPVFAAPQIHPTQAEDIAAYIATLQTK